MTVKNYGVNVIRVGSRGDGEVMVHCRARNREWADDRWWLVPASNPGASTFLATALTCIASGLPAELGVEDTLEQYSRIYALYVLRD